MTRMRTKKHRKIALHSDLLPDLRQCVETIDYLKRLLGPIAVFHVVVDANIIISDILWLLTKRRNPIATTALQECIAAGTIVVYVTPMVIAEVKRFPLEARNQRFDLEAWMAELDSYKQSLQVMEPDPNHVEKYKKGQDPDDAPTLALADVISACGILSKDGDIEAMGGKVIPIEFVLQARDYSRKAVVSVSIQVGGYFFVVSASGVLQVLMRALKSGTAWFRTLPDPVKFLTFVALILVALNTRSRHALSAWLKRFGAELSDALPQILEIVVCLANAVTENRAVPPTLPGA